MLERAAEEHGLDVQRSFVVGDRYGDVELAQNARARSILVRTGYGEGELAWQAAKWPSQPHFVAEDLAQAADRILSHQKSGVSLRKSQSQRLSTFSFCPRAS